ncbi:mTERF domain-containing protein 1 [Durusdinium trenchii]|uniref:Mitochondrial n=1 Tax=Durusdinium trenchii TaxID=1381693 RepID=A0ABP0KEK8_9DINO
MPAWWRNGWPRGRVDSRAEAELLSQLAALLMPGTAIGELFRSFPATQGWKGHYLEPDLTAHGVLKKKTAALFVEYDGFWRHGETEGMAMDRKKNAALLDYAPAGSFVIRLTHSVRKPVAQAHTLWVRVPRWREGEERSLVKTLHSILEQMVAGMQDAWRPNACKRMKQSLLRMAIDKWTLAEDGQQFAMKAATLAGRNSSKEVCDYLAAEGFSPHDIATMKRIFESRSQAIEGNLKPKLRWLLGLGLSKMQVAKAVAGFPRVLGLSIEENLKPTVEARSSNFRIGSSDPMRRRQAQGEMYSPCLLLRVSKIRQPGTWI